MSTLAPPSRTLRTRPIADPRAVVQGEKYRITVLTDGLLRLEYADDGVFEDRASSFAVCRELPVPDFRVLEDGPHLEIVTERLHLVYDRGRFTTSGLSVAVRGGVTVYHSVWRFGEVLGDADGTVAGMPALRGTARTLDEADGAVPLEDGVVSRTGFALLDDSASMLFTDDGWVAPRPPAPAGGERHDLYVFGYGHDYAEALRAFYAVSGPQPLLPRFALGNWWSRFHRYTAGTYRELIERFDAEGLPFSVSVIDMDWHVVDVDPALGSGWTGYSWNRDLFPDPDVFLAWLHERGLRVTLNVHPADGVRAHEDAYEEMARALGRDTSQRDPVAFDVTDREFLAAYFDVLHRRLEDDGVDFWWVDWQSGPHSRVAGIDPLWMLNHFHFLDAARDGRRPLTFSRYAGPGSHRYPVGFSGDTVISWDSLAFQPSFTASAANIGYGWWSHDIGGHMHGVRDDELATRWLQLGVFSPVLRLHSGSNAFITKEPWTFPEPARTAMTEALRLRHRLVPYLHTMNHRAAFEGAPLVAPLYHRWPEAGPAYEERHEFTFGTELLVAPVTSPSDPVTRTASTSAWLPPGTWVDLFTGLVYDVGPDQDATGRPGTGREIVLHRDLSSVPVLARSGAIVPLDARAVPGNDVGNPAALEVVVVVGADGAFDLVEDDGVGDGSDPDGVVRTPLRWDDPAGARAVTGASGDARSGRLVVGPAAGGTAGLDSLPATRSWTVSFPAFAGGRRTDVDVVRATVDGVRVGSTTTRGLGGAFAVTVEDVPVGAELVLLLDASRGVRLRANDVVGRCFDVLDRAQVAYDLKERIQGVIAGTVSSGGSLTTVVSRLQALGLPRVLESALGEVLLAQG
ncbi:glycoside hydrolase family 31 protein [Luteimicrobium subarcticum]|uniref:Alpha-glucosidase (Family GH31 glycosyl hydrolase) n=1 Tax=Luteimicrobium subarcticum TaxID=620910 RepID=A0A2M8W1S0_9MICO|nr:TIM-barrel domain-containing protein [Luteimicrobium subarcticum]PJI84877.1 alpha-glucosidase (family GH31 glycosyl hydrolase) [Luteimicrobium subarcticum]